jgi:uncharacterized cupin superfamily protein
VNFLDVARWEHFKERCLGRLIRPICIIFIFAKQCRRDSGHDASELGWRISKEGSAKTRESASSAFKEEVVGLFETVTAETAATLKRHEFCAILGARASAGGCVG